MIGAEFVGRSREVAVAQDLLSRVEAGQSGMLLVMGEAGAGKSTLADRIVGHAVERGFEAAAGASTGVSEPMPFAPLVGLLCELVDSPRVGPLIADDSVVRALIAGDASGGALAVSASVAEVLTDRILALNRAAPVLLLLEDLHWADQSTLELLSHLIRTANEQRLLVVGTVRTRLETPANQKLLGELMRHPRVDRLDLEPFDLAELYRLVRLVTREVPSDALVSDLLTKSGGNPFLARELIRIDPRDWSRLPGTVGDIVRASLEPLSSSTRQALEVASLTREPIDANLVAIASDLPVLDIEASLQRAVEEDVLRLEGAALRFRHALLRDACGASMLPSRRQRLHGRIADALAARRRSDAGDVAWHLEEAGRLVEALDASMAAARAANGEHGSIEALPSFHRAVRLWPDVLDAERRFGQSLVDVASSALECAFYLGDTVAAGEFARVALRHIDPSARPDEFIMIACRLSELEWQEGATAEALDLLERAADSLSDQSTPIARAHVLDRRSFHEAMQGAAGDAQTHAEEALELAREAGDEQLQVEILLRVGLARALGGEFSEGLEMTREARELAFADRHHRSVIRANINLTALLLSIGDLVGARREGEHGSALAEELGAPKAWQTHAHAWLARTLIATGDLRAASLVLDNAASPPADMFRSVLDVAGAELALASGEVETARELIDRVNISTEDHVAWWLQTELMSRRIAVTEGRHELALAGIDEILDIAEFWPDTAVMQIADVAMQGLSPSDQSRADAIIERCERKAQQLKATTTPADTDARLHHIRARHADHAGIDSGEHWRAAADRYAACGRPIEAGWALIHAARRDDVHRTPSADLAATIQGGRYAPPAPLVEALEDLAGRRASTRRSADEPTVYRFNDYEIDSVAYELRLAGDPIPTEPQVLDLITYLARNPGELLTKEQLLDEIWGDRFVSHSALAVRIRTARRLLGDDGQRQEVIRTVHGRGYKFVAEIAAR